MKKNIICLKETVSERDLCVLDQIQFESFKDYNATFHENVAEELCKPSEFHKISNDNLIYKVTINETIIGGILVTLMPNSIIYIHRIFLLPQFQRMGYGTQIIQTIMNVYDQAVSFTLHCPSSLRKNIEFYKKMDLKLKKMIIVTKLHIN